MGYVLIGVLVLLVLWWRARASKLRSSNLAANQATQAIRPPEAGLHPRTPRASLAGSLAEHFLNKGGKF